MDIADIFDKHKKLIFNLVVIGIALFIAFKIYNGQAMVAQGLRDAADDQLKKNDILGDISQSEKKLGAYKKLLANKDPNSVIATIGTIAKDMNIKIDSIRPADVVKGAEYNEYPYYITLITPGYHALGKFISQLESNKDIFVIESVQIQPSTQAQGLNVSLTVNFITDKQ